MKMIKRYAGILMMLTLLVGFTSCEDDEDIYDDLMGRTWVGDLWFGSDYNPIESGIRLDNNGLGIDYQVYDYDGRPAGDLPFRWWVDYGTLYLDYGRDFALREIRGVRVRDVICKVTCILMENILIILSCRCNRIRYDFKRKGVKSIDLTPFLFERIFFIFSETTS